MHGIFSQASENKMEGGVTEGEADSPVRQTLQKLLRTLTIRSGKSVLPSFHCSRPWSGER